MWEYYVRFAEAFFNEVHFHENVREIDFTEKKKEGQRIFFFFWRGCCKNDDDENKAYV